jgi:hypothetical protein
MIKFLKRLTVFIFNSSLFSKSDTTKETDSYFEFRGPENEKEVEALYSLNSNNYVKDGFETEDNNQNNQNSLPYRLSDNQYAR